MEKSHPEKALQGNDRSNRKQQPLKKTKGSGDPPCEIASAKSSTSNIPSNLASHEREEAGF